MQYSRLNTKHNIQKNTCVNKPYINKNELLKTLNNMEKISNKCTINLSYATSKITFKDIELQTVVNTYIIGCLLLILLSVFDVSYIIIYSRQNIFFK